MTKRILISLAIIGAVSAIVVGATTAYFSDTETLSGNTFTAGTLDLTVDDENPYTEHITVDNIKPGWARQWVFWLKNTGNLDGKLSIEFSDIINNDNGLTEPESDVDSTGGDGEGELGEYLEAASTLRHWVGGQIVDQPEPFSWTKLNDLGGQTFTSYTLAADEADAQQFILDLKLPLDVGNIVQSDSVEFDIIFKLEQVH